MLIENHSKMEDLSQEEKNVELFPPVSNQNFVSEDDLKDTDIDTNINDCLPSKPKIGDSFSAQHRNEEGRNGEECNVSSAEKSEKCNALQENEHVILDNFVETGHDTSVITSPSVQRVVASSENNSKNFSEEQVPCSKQQYLSMCLNSEKTVLLEDSALDSDEEPLSSKTNTRINDFEDDNTSNVQMNLEETDERIKELELELQSIQGKDGDNTTKYVEKNLKTTDKRRKELDLELQNIHSETQRLARESEISLSYHKPQITSLVEFLNRKSSSKSAYNTPTFLKSSLRTERLSCSEKAENVKNCSQTTKPKVNTPQISAFKKKLLHDRNVFSITPKLSAQTDIELELNETPKGLNNLMTRFLKHHLKKTDPTVEDVKMHLVCKDVDKDGHEQLKAQEITVKLHPKDTGTSLNTEKFSVFKGQLLSTITKKKLKKQESLMAAHELDNEEGFEEEFDDESDSDANESEVEGDNKNEGEENDENGSEVEENDENDSAGSDSELDEELDSHKETMCAIKPSTFETLSYHILKDTEAASDGHADSDKGEHVESTHSDSLKLFLEDSEMPDTKTVDSNKESQQQLVLEDSQVLDENADCKKPEEEMDSSFELMGSIFPAQQPGGGLKYGGYVGSDDEACSQRTPIRCSTVFSKKPSDYDSETASQSDSPLFSSRRFPAIFNKGDINDSQEFNDLLPLCSGRFSTQNDASTKKSSLPSNYVIKKNGNSLKKVLFSNNNDSYSQNIDELLGVCSGKFTDSGQVNVSEKSNSQDQFPQSLTQEIPSINTFSPVKCEHTNSKTVDTPLCLGSEEFQERKETEQLNLSAFHKNVLDSDDDDDEICAPKKKVASKQKLKLNFESDESDVEDIEQNSGEENEEEEKNEDEYSISEENVDEEHQEQKKPLKVTDFFDEEAELSGSDVGSDDEAEDDEEGQIFDDAVPSDEELTAEELRDQIGKVHLKRLMDDDKRELRLFQEVYLEDGDLHTDGNGRERKFRWRNSNFGENENKGEDGSEDELEGNALENEKWRIQRHEREKWLQEQEALHSIENWTGFKLVKRTKPTSASQKNYNLTQKGPFLNTNLTQSFLARNKEFCSQLAEKFQKQESDHVGKRSTKNFVFVSKSPTKAVKRTADQVIIKEAKIRKLTTSMVTTSVKKSVFNFI